MLNILAATLMLVALQAPSGSRSLQGDTRAWTQHPAMHRMWERLQVACRAGCDKADPMAFEREALDVVQEMGPSLGMTRAQMREHVHAIPRQMLKVGAEDPAILTDYDKFLVALVGPA